MNFPEPVFLKRLAAARLVLIFGIYLSPLIFKKLFMVTNHHYI